MPEEQPTTPETTPTASPDAKYTDKDVDKFKGDARREGREAAERQVAETLGVSIEEAKTIIAERRQSDEQSKSDLEKANARAAAAEQRAEQAETLAETRLVDAEMRTAMLEAGVPPERVKSALRLAGRDAVKVGKEGAVEGIKESVEALKTSDSYLFEAPKPTAQRTAPEVDTPAPEPMDVSAMSKEEFAKVQERVMRGETVMPVSPETAAASS